jgi:hypothetical protein
MEWLDSNAPGCITSWEDLLKQFYNKFFPMSRVNEARKEISSFTKDEDKKFSECWGRFKDLLIRCPLMVMKNGDSCNSSTKGCPNPTVA